MISETLKNRFSEEVKRRGFYPYEAAAFSGLSPGVILDCMRFGEPPCTRKMAILCIKFNLSADYLMGLSDENKPLNPVCDFGGYYDYCDTFKERFNKVFKTKKELNEFCEKIGRKASNFYRNRKYGSFPPFEVCCEIAVHKNVSMDWLFCLSEEGGPEK